MVEVALDHDKKGFTMGYWGQGEANPVLRLAAQTFTMDQSCPLGTSPHGFREKKVSFGAHNKFPCWFRKEKIFLGANNTFFNDQASWIKMAGYCSRFYCVFIDLEFVSVHENPNMKELGQYTAILRLTLGQ